MGSYMYNVCVGSHLCIHVHVQCMYNVHTGGFDEGVPMCGVP